MEKLGFLGIDSRSFGMNLGKDGAQTRGSFAGNVQMSWGEDTRGDWGDNRVARIGFHATAAGG